MRKLLSVLAAAMIVGAVVSCGPSTTIKNSWKDPSIMEPVHFDKILGLMIEKDGATRRQVEDYIVQRVTANNPGVQAVAAYTLLSGDDLTDKERSRQIVEEAGIDGAIVVRMVGVDKQTTYVPGSYPTPYYNFYGYYDWAWPTVYDPGYLQTDTIVNLETLIYSVKDGKLLWSGVTETFNPSSMDDLLKGTGDAVARATRKDGIFR